MVATIQTAEHVVYTKTIENNSAPILESNFLKPLTMPARIFMEKQNIFVKINIISRQYNHSA